MASMAAKLRSMAVESALKTGVLDFAAGQCHGFENPLVPERGILILFLHRLWVFAGDVFVNVPILFSHKKIEPALTVREPAKARLRTTSFAKRTTRNLLIR